jgi:hypothetical protein
MSKKNNSKKSLFDSIGEKEAKQKAIEYAKKYAPSETNPWPCHIRKVGEDFLFADQNYEVVSLGHCPFIPIPMGLVGDDVRQRLNQISGTIFQSICALPMAFSFPMFTPSLLIRLSSKPTTDQIKEIEKCKQALESKYNDWIEHVTQKRNISIEEADRLPESQSMLQNAMELSIMEYSFEHDTLKYQQKTWPKIISSTEVITQYLRAKRLICMTKGFVEVDSQISSNYLQRFEVCENMLKSGLVNAHNRFTSKLGLDRYCSQLQQYGRLTDLSKNSDKDVAMILMQYTFTVIHELEKWFLRAAGGVREELMFYHLCSSTVLPDPSHVPDSIKKECQAHQFNMMSFRKLSSLSIVRPWFKKPGSSSSSSNYTGDELVCPELIYTLSYKSPNVDLVSKKEHITQEMICSNMYYLFQEYCYNNRTKLLEENYESYHDLITKQSDKKNTIQMYLPGLEDPLTC